MQALLNPGDEVIILKPYWITYPELVKMADGVPVFVDSSEAQDFKADVADIEQAVTPRTCLLYTSRLHAVLIHHHAHPVASVQEKAGAQCFPLRQNARYLVIV